MNCARVGALLVDLLYEELDAGERASVTSHLGTCRACELRWSRIRAVAAAADRWSAPPVSRGIAERALMRVAADRRAARVAMIFPARIVGRVLLGGGAALLSLLLVAGVASRQTTIVGAGALAVAWTVLYSGVFLASPHPSIRGLTGGALIGSGVALALVPVASIPGVVEACERWVRAAGGSAPATLLLVVAAAAYTGAPLLVGGLGARVEPVRGRVVDGLRLSALYAVLIAPAVVLQCVALPLEITALWMTGAVAGAAGAGPVGLRFGGWLRQVTAK
jgi:hypothetical protein